MTVGKRLKDERKRLDLTQDELATQLGVTRYAQMNFEKDINLPGGAYLLAALDRGVDVMYVLSGYRVQMDPEDARVLSALRTASAGARSVALAALGLETAASPGMPGAAPTLNFNNSTVGPVISNNGPLDQRYMQINMGGRKKKKS
ncbi:helix-turn-helix domain-containing protein [Xanthomonas cucurbitae]|uniref:Helix-turn-helix domain-containing protein n=1 Tax=Xanthomonas cucurbitae TaxID=56453 RepID=A0ABY7Y8M0_9XANT|nr:helix-turn-helix domain-containing protein [Xanthomonas cucurbitae]WDM66300.1 helix-turn-helix domain-containing protein [Xanthomonas cucurbitae]WDM70177.1 helix-turn-helix domain-containing protein [Xanthomonas cucurbitae]